jgi:hypothetical protein
LKGFANFDFSRTLLSRSKGQAGDGKRSQTACRANHLLQVERSTAGP